MSTVPFGLRRAGLTLLETLIAISIIGVLTALGLVAVGRVRDAAARVQSSNNLRNIMLAMHSYADAHAGGLPPTPVCTKIGNTVYPAKRAPSPFVCILPFVEQQRVRVEAQTKIPYPPVALFLSPADPTAAQAIADGEAVSSYAANAVAFQGSPSLVKTFSDGTSNTIAFAEHYAYKCGPTQNSTVFYYWTNRSDFSGSRRATFADDLDVYPVTGGSPPVSRPVLGDGTFQVAPSVRECNPHLAQTPHAAGMVTAMADGSVRILAPSISSPVYWGAVTPNKGEVAPLE
jgi:prepilin-type N-terminal cleavage/methylation domain-containing protein